MLRPEPLTTEAFAPFGTVIAADPATAREINDGACTRFHALAEADPGPEGLVILSIFRARPWPSSALAMLERHPLGTQAFMPLGGGGWLVAVAERPLPDAMRLFRARGDQGVQYGRGVWHHPLLVTEPRDFLVVDRDGAGPNLEVVRFEPREMALHSS